MFLKGKFFCLFENWKLIFISANLWDIQLVTTINLFKSKAIAHKHTFKNLMFQQIRSNLRENLFNSVFIFQKKTFNFHNFLLKIWIYRQKNLNHQTIEEISYVIFPKLLLLLYCLYTREMLTNSFSNNGSLTSNNYFSKILPKLISFMSEPFLLHYNGYESWLYAGKIHKELQKIVKVRFSLSLEWRQKTTIPHHHNHGMSQWIEFSERRWALFRG